MSKKKLFLLKYLFLALAFIGLFAPTIFLFIKNRSIYFVKVEGWSIGFAGAVGLAYGMYLAKVGMKKFNPMVASGIFMVIMYCLNSVSEFIFVHSVATFIGICLYNILMIPSNYFAKLLDIYTDEQVRVGVRNAKPKVKKVKTEELESGRC